MSKIQQFFNLKINIISPIKSEILYRMTQMMLLLKIDLKLIVNINNLIRILA